jgi:hypothetical protein
MLLLRYLWPLPVTLIGLCVAMVAKCTGGRMHLNAGVVEAWGGWPGWWLRGGRVRQGGAAVALGHVIVARDETCMHQSRSHEMYHVRQYERFGIFLIPAYYIIAFSLRLRGLHPYLDHPMEPPVGD